MMQIANLAAVNAVVFLLILWGISTTRDSTGSKLASIGMMALLAITNGALAVKIWMIP